MKSAIRWIAAILTVLFNGSLGISQNTDSTGPAQFVGSKACSTCHQEQYEGWKQTRMANVVRDPKQHPDAVLADFTSVEPLRTFDLS